MDTNISEMYHYGSHSSLQQFSQIVWRAGTATAEGLNFMCSVTKPWQLPQILRSFIINSWKETRPTAQVESQQPPKTNSHLKCCTEGHFSQQLFTYSCVPYPTNNNSSLLQADNQGCRAMNVGQGNERDVVSYRGEKRIGL